LGRLRSGDNLFDHPHDVQNLERVPAALGLRLRVEVERHQKSMASNGTAPPNHNNLRSQLFNSGVPMKRMMAQVGI
jgi:hypothetical protein